MLCPNAFIGSALFFFPFSFSPKFFQFFAIYSFLLITADSTKIDGTFPPSNADSDFLNSPSHSHQIHSSQFGQFEQTKTIEFVSNSNNDPDELISPHPHHRHRNRRRHRRRLPFGAIGRFFAKLGKGGKVAAASADDVAAVGTKFARNGDKIDDFVVGGTRMGKNVGKGPPSGRGLPRRQQYRSYDAPSFNPYSLPNGEIRKARSKALTGANLALATGGIAAGIWYFSGENATLFIAIIIGIGLICILLAASLLAYCLLCRNKKRGYYAVNEEDIVMAFLKKMLFYMFC